MADCSNEADLGSTAPIDPSQRLISIDALRGLALFGVLAINLETEFRVSIFQQFLPAPSGGGLDGFIDEALELFVDMKAFALFSLLFGVGLAIQYDRLARSDRRAVLLIRRLGILLAFGLVHLLLIWNGDILTEYAIAGLVVLPFLFWPTWLIAGASMLFLGAYVLQPMFPTLVAFPTRAAILEIVQSADRIYAAGGFLDVLSFRLRELPAFLPLHTYVFPRTLGLFLLGMLSWRAGLFRLGLGQSRWLWLTAFLAIGGGLFLARGEFARPYANLASSVVLALGYAAAVIAVYDTAAGRQWLRWAEPIGRMAFTNYIMQSIVLGFIFYGYGLGLFAKLSSAVGLVMVSSIYIAQVVLSRLWLARFRYGPVEWLWRALMYGRAPEFRKPPLSRPLGMAA